MTERIISLCLVFMLFITALPFSSSAATADEAAVGGVTSGTTGDCKWSYDADTDELKITGSGRMADYDSRYDTPWNASIDSVKSITIEGGVTYVGNYSFEGCKATAISIADSVTEIGERGFADMNKANSCKMSSNLKTIGDKAFQGLGVTGLTVPNNLKEIGSYAFYDCDNLRFLTIPNACACDFDWYTFAYCKALENISIGTNAVIGDKCFAHCPSLKSFQVSADNPNYTAAGGHLFSKDQSKLIFYCNGNGAVSSEFSTRITELGDYALSGNKTLTSIVLPAGLKKIGSNTFEMSQVTNLTFRGTSLQEAGESAFYGTPWKRNLPDSGLIYISSLAYLYKGTAPESITIKSGTKGIGDKCFYGQMTLENVTLPDSLLRIGNGAFDGCKNLTGIDLPSKLQSIGDRGFNDCRAITRMNLPDSVTEIGENCLRYCKSLKDLRLSSNLTEIPYGAFSSCDSLEKNFDLPENIEKIGLGAFHLSGVSSLTIVNRNVEFESGYLGVGVRRFRGYHNSTAEAYAKENNMYFEPLDKWVAGKLTTFLSADDKTTLTLKDVTTTNVYAQISQTGTEYTIPNVDRGYYSLTAAKKNHVSRTYYTIWVKDQDFTQDVELHPIGDINGDGKITNMDFARANSHARGVNLLSEYELQCADVVKGDGEVTNMDAGRINSAARGMSPLW